MDDFVRVKIDGRHISKEYVGKILDIDQEEEEINVDFMQEIKTKGKFMYYWGDKKDIGWTQMHNIVKYLQAPVLSTLSTKRRVLYEF